MNRIVQSIIDQQRRFQEQLASEYEALRNQESFRFMGIPVAWVEDVPPDTLVIVNRQKLEEEPKPCRS